MPFTYILQCADGSYYVGSTWRSRGETRVDEHNAGHGAKFTRTRRPVALAWAGYFERMEDAYAFEKQVQGWRRAKREALIRGDWDALPRLASRRRSGRSG